MDEIDRTLRDLEFTQSRLTVLYDLSSDQLESLSALPTSEVDSASPLRPKVHDASSPLTPQMKWNIINKSSKYSPKYNGHPDEMPLRSDEFHVLARLLQKLSLIVNDRLMIADLYCQPGLVGRLVGTLCEAPTSYRRYQRHGESQVVSLPPRIMLRPLASHRNIAYVLFALFLKWLLGNTFVLKVFFVVLIIWAVKICFFSNDEQREYSKKTRRISVVDKKDQEGLSAAASQSFDD